MLTPLLQTHFDTSGWWALGIGCSLLACFGTTAGMLMQKYAHNLDPSIAGNEARKKRLWWISLVLMVIVPAPLDVIALAMAAQSLLAPLTAVTVLLTVVLAPCFLPEKITKVDIVATILIISGAVVTTIFGAHSQQIFDVPALLAAYHRVEFVIFQVFVIGGIVGILVWIRLSPDPFAEAAAAKKQAETPSTPRTSAAPPFFASITKSAYSGVDSTQVVKRWYHLPHKLIPFAHAVVAALTGAQQIVLTKTFAELVVLTLNGYTQMHYVYTWVVLILAIVFAIFQIWFISSGLERFDAIFYLSVYNALLIVFQVICGGVYFNEFQYVATTTANAVLFTVGVAIVISGVAVLTRRNPNHEYQRLEENDPDEEKNIQQDTSASSKDKTK